MIVVIDNYDSFTYNLVQQLGELGVDPWVYRNDKIELDELIRLNPSHIMISPGPGTPERDAGISNQVIAHFHGRVPILGVCLGHQCITHTFGGRVDRAENLMHGKTSLIQHGGGALFAGISSPFQATRYHSLIAYEPLPDDLQVIARTAEGEVMAIRHKQAPTYGVQFHPESILTPDGKRLLHNFLDIHGVTAMDATNPASSGDVSEITMPRAIESALDRQSLSATEAEAVMMLIMAGEATPAQIAAYLVALRIKGETVAEITGFARAMRSHVTPVHATRQPLVDTCGTGGDGAHTFNISTTAAFVVAGAGVAVAKHGNRSVSSRSGSADVLQALGVNLELTPEQVGRCIDEVGLGFLFAPRLHPAMRHAIGPRREMGVRTVFNILGPLTNPAGASAQLLGVYQRELVEPIAQVLRDLGTQSAFVVCSEDGLDELSTVSPNRVARVVNGQVQQLTIDATTLGIKRTTLAALRGGDAEDNAVITRAILNGEPGPQRDIVLLNAAAALVAVGSAGDLPTGLELAQQSLDSGQAQRVLAELVRFSNAAEQEAAT